MRNIPAVMAQAIEGMATASLAGVSTDDEGSPTASLSGSQRN